jgi:DNA polymerase III subunit gamma/tau
MSLYHEYRPTEWDHIFGNETVVEALQGDLKKQKRSHAFLFHGPTGCGKTTLGRLVAKELGCIGDNLREVDSADFRGIETVREIRRNINYKPTEGDCRVWILDECHQMNNIAQSALLKMLEDTPKHVYFILCTTDPQKLLKTIRGRCSDYKVELLDKQEMYNLLSYVVECEEEELERDVYKQIIIDSQGHPRNALQILDQVLSVAPEKRLRIAERSAELESQTIDLCRSLLKGESWKKISTILSGLKSEDPESVRRSVLGYCQSVLLNGGKNDRAAMIMYEFKDHFYDCGFAGLVFSCYSVVHGE